MSEKIEINWLEQIYIQLKKLNENIEKLENQKPAIKENKIVETIHFTDLKQVTVLDETDKAYKIAKGAYVVYVAKSLLKQLPADFGVPIDLELSDKAAHWWFDKAAWRKIQ